MVRKHHPGAVPLSQISAGINATVPLSHFHAHYHINDEPAACQFGGCLLSTAITDY